MSIWRYLKEKRRAKTQRMALAEQLVREEFQRGIDFPTWLLSQLDRHDSIGDLVRHITADSQPADRFVKILGWWKTACLDNHPASEKAFFDTFQKAWEEFRAGR
jgi:hypothetical protein